MLFLEAVLKVNASYVDTEVTVCKAGNDNERDHGNPGYVIEEGAIRNDNERDHGNPGYVEEGAIRNDLDVKGNI